MSRPKGSKNKKTLQDEDYLPIKKEAEPTMTILFGNAKELKKQIRKLRKLKNQMTPNSKERVELHRKIKEMKEQLFTMNNTDLEKKPLIDEIIKLEPSFVVLQINLNKFSVEQLQKHLDRVKQRKNN